jgi:hypothetical protein
MATLTGTQIANTYKQLLQVGSSNTGLTGTVQSVQDGEGNNSPLQLSQSAVNINGTFQLSGVTLTANASTLNAVADLTGATGIVAVSGGNVYGRTITGGAGVSITNADGTEGNPTIALNTTGVTSASYGPATNIEVNSVGQIVSAGAATSVSVSGVTANTFTGGTFAGTTGDFSSNVSVGGNLVITGEFSPASLSVTGTINANKISATDATFNDVVSAAFFVGDGSGLVNVPSAEGGTVKTLEAGTGIALYIDAGVTSTVNSSGTIAVSANQNFGTVSVSTALAVTGSALFDVVSATSYYGDGSNLTGVIQTSVSAYTVNQLTVVSAASFPDDATLNFGTGNDLQIVHNGLHSVIKEIGTGSLFVQSNEIKLTNTGSFSMLTLADGQDADFPYGIQVSGTVSATSFVGPTITSINSLIENVSALTSVNTAAITSINTILGDGSNFATSAELAATSLALATSIDTANTRITSVSDFAVALSATMATSIGTANTRITSVSDYAVALSATLATSIGNSNTNITTNANAITSINTVVGNVSALTSVNAAAITSINVIIGDGTGFATDAELASVSSRVTSVSDYAVALSATLATSIANVSSTMATSIANHLPLAGGTLTGTVSGTDFYVSAVAIGVDSLLGKNLHIGTAAVADIVSLTDGTSIAVDFNSGQNFAVQLAGNRTLESPTNCVAGQTGSILIIQDGTGGRTLSYGANWKFPAGTAPTLSTAISAVDRVDYIVYTSTAVQAIATLDIK